MREAREQPLALGSFTNARCTKEDNSSRLVQSHSRRSGTFSTGREICKKLVDYSIAKEKIDSSRYSFEDGRRMESGGFQGYCRLFVEGSARFGAKIARGVVETVSGMV